MMRPREIAEANTILLSTVGSGAHGLAIPGSDDHDEMGVCIEPPSHVIGLHRFEQDVFRTKPEGVRSEHGDTDRTIYSARKFCRLALGGNPSIITLFYTIPRIEHELGRELLNLAPAFAARSAGNAFLGYMTQQRQRLLGERGQMNVKRPELVEAHGFDCYLDDTQFLTTKGWKGYDDIGDNDSLGTVNPSTGLLGWERPFDRVEKEYTGVIHHMEGSRHGCSVTPNHRMLVAPIRNRGVNPRVDPFVFSPMASLEAHGDYAIRSTVTPAYGLVVDEILILATGMYVSDGHVAKRLRDGTASVLGFTQKEGGAMMPYLQRLSELSPLRKFPYERATLFTLANREIASRVCSECGEKSADKHLPSWAFVLEPRSAQLLLDVLISGDGTSHRSGGHVYYTSSKQLADDVQALAVIAGKSAVIWGPYGKMYQVRIQDGSVEIIRRGKHFDDGEHVRGGRVVCFSVPSETLITRRAGKVSLQGNTKYAMHMLRLGFQGVEFLETGHLTLPMPEPDRAFVYSVRLGEVELNEVLTKAGLLEQRLSDLLDHSPLPDQPDADRVNTWLVAAYQRYWETNP